MIRHQSWFKNSKILSRFSAILLLTACSFAAVTVKADILVTSVSDSIRLMETALPLPYDESANGSNSSGNFLQRIIGTGDNATGGYQSNQRTTTTATSINVLWGVHVPTSGSLGPVAFGSGNSEIRFTSMSNQQYTAAGDNHMASGSQNTSFNFKLRDLTNGIDLVEFTEGWQDGIAFNNTNGSLTGNLVQGNLYSWTSDYIASKRVLNNRFGGSGAASLNITAIPEPSAAAMLGLAGLGMLLRRRRR